jgi:hypothetical protein
MSWAGVDFKLNEADFFFREMQKDLIPPEYANPALRAYIAPQIAAGAMIDYSWQSRFYFHVDAFLVATRSIPDIIQSWFGLDAFAQSQNAPQTLKTWVQQLPSQEKILRESFQRKFERQCKKFNRHPLSAARHITIHHYGTPPVVVTVPRLWGQPPYLGGPTAIIPTVDFWLTPAANDPTVPPALTSQFLPVRPSLNDFHVKVADPNHTVRTDQLFPFCQGYL